MNFDSRVSFLNNSALEDSSATKAKHLESLRISEQISNTLTGFDRNFCKNCSMRVDTQVRVRIFSECRNIAIF